MSTLARILALSLAIFSANTQATFIARNNSTVISGGMFVMQTAVDNHIRTLSENSTWRNQPMPLAIETRLLATAPDPENQAFTKKKSVKTTPLPLPAAVWLFGAVLLGFLSVSKMKRQL